MQASTDFEYLDRIKYHESAIKSREMLECLISLAIFHYKIPEEIIGIARINVRSMIRSIDGYRPPCRHIFNMINDVDRMDRQGGNVSKLVICEKVVAPHPSSRQ
jgi:hypothetical protein